MLQNPKFSIIIPIYNTGIILPETIESVLNQTFRNFELLLINDGSTDDSGRICDEYAQKDKRIRAIHKTNGGISDARNVGIINALGDYIAFCDHDDIYENNLLEKAFATAIKQSAEVVKFSVSYEIERKTARFDHKPRLLKETNFTSEDFANKLIDLINDDIFTCVWDGIYKRSLIIENKIFFDTSFKTGFEDISFNYQIIPHIKKIALIHDILYKHYIRKSLSTSARYHDEIISRYIEYPQRTNEIIKSLKIQNDKIEISYFYFFYKKTFISIISYMIKMNKSELFFKRTINQLFEQNPLIRSSNVTFLQFIKHIPDKKHILGYPIILLFKKKKFSELYHLSKIFFQI